MNSFMKQMLAAIALLGFATSAQAQDKVNKTLVEKRIYNMTDKSANIAVTTKDPDVGPTPSTITIIIPPRKYVSLKYPPKHIINVKCNIENISAIWTSAQINKNSMFSIHIDHNGKLLLTQEMVNLTPQPVAYLDEAMQY